MEYSLLKRYRLVSAVFLICFHTAPVIATDWYSNDPQLNKNQGFGGFAPATIEQDLYQQQLSIENNPPEMETESAPYRDTNPWDSGAAPADRVVKTKPAITPQDYSRQPPAAAAPVQRKSSPLGNIYEADPYPPANYGAYPPAGVSSPNVDIPGYGGPWNRGSNFQGPWHNGGPGFSPWGNSGNFGNGPFNMSGPGDWFN